MQWTIRRWKISVISRPAPISEPEVDERPQVALAVGEAEDAATEKANGKFKPEAKEEVEEEVEEDPGARMLSLRTREVETKAESASRDGGDEDQVPLSPEDSATCEEGSPRGLESETPASAVNADGGNEDGAEETKPDDAASPRGLESETPATAVNEDGGNEDGEEETKPDDAAILKLKIPGQYSCHLLVVAQFGSDHLVAVPKAAMEWHYHRGTWKNKGY